MKSSIKDIIFLIFFYWISGIFIIIALWLAYSAIHITGILLGILPEPWFSMLSIEYYMRGNEGLINLLCLVVGFASNKLWDIRKEQLKEKAIALGKKRDLEWDKELKFQKYKSYYERNKKKKKKKKKKN